MALNAPCSLLNFVSLDQQQSQAFAFDWGCAVCVSSDETQLAAWRNAESQL
jgi:hypothetical protein